MAEPNARNAAHRGLRKKYMGRRILAFKTAENGHFQAAVRLSPVVPLL
jgi:hypothetical protein